jgi:hypothetical protein
MHGFLKAKGARFMIGLIEEDTEIETLCRARGIDWVSLETSLRDPYNGHWTAEGHALVCRLVHERLSKLIDGAGS